MLAILLQVTASVLLGITEIATHSSGMRVDASVTLTPSTETSALKDFYFSTGGTDWLWKSVESAGNIWNVTSATADPCRDLWQGVNCTITGNSYHVKELSLPQYDLFGTIPESIGNLTFLQHLDLSKNRLFSQLPIDCWLSLGDLQQLSMYENNFSGLVPVTLGQLYNLRVLDLSSNRLNGTSVSHLCTLTSLVSLNVNENFFTGTVPTCLGSLTGLVAFRLGKNGFDGTIPAALETLQSLNQLDLSFNLLTGSIPSFLCSCVNMSGLYFGHNYKTGTLPDCLGGLSVMEDLGIEFNSFSGTAPGSLGQLPLLVTIWLNCNQLSGHIPTFADQPRMTEFLLYSNALTGTIPDCFGAMTALLYMSISDNFLTGSVPVSIGLPVRNTVIDVSNNLLTGSLPASLSQVSRLFQLKVQNNFLGGSLEGIFNASTHEKLIDVLVYQNEFTGTLPDELFRLKRVDTIIAIENCFSGTLSKEICNSKLLVSLILDGLHTSRSCRNTLLPVAHAYGVSNSFHGTIPACLLQLPHLTSLHLSGNSLTGTLPDSASISANLLDLAVSHNALTGTIPQAMQLRNWRNLDLSFNRLSGTLASNFGALVGPATALLDNVTFNSTDNSMNIQNNRISGSFPQPLAHLQNVSSLGSNMFSCKVDKSDLPQHDSDYHIYQCASNAFNGPYYVFIGICSIVGVVLCAGALYPQKFLAESASLMNSWRHEFEGSSRNIVYVKTASDILCELSVLCTVLIVTVLMPWYAAASHYYGTYAHQYAWVVSAAFLSGTVPAAVDLSLYCTFMVAVICGAALIVARKDRMERNRGVNTVQANVKATTSPSKAKSMPRWRRYSVYAAFLSLNLVIVVGANAGFVTIAVGQSNFVVVLAQVLLSVFKLTWNTVCTPYLIYLVKEIIAQKSSTASLVTVQVFLALFNNIAIPCLVVAVLSPSCFYSVFDPPGDVTSDFVVQSCYIGTSVVDCSFRNVMRLTASFSPPFKYDYQCSSSFVTYYAPAFVYLGLAAAFAAPLAKFTGMHLLHRAKPGTRWHRVLAKLVPRLLKPPKIEPVLTTSAEIPGQFSPAAVFARGLWERYRPIFDANNFIIALITYLGILLTFGVVFPPLAVVMCVAILSVSVQTKVEVGRYLFNVRAENHPELASSIEGECHNAVSIVKLRRGLFMTICFCCGFYALFLYDTLGNAVGQHRAVWVLYVMLFFPLGLYAAIRAQREYRRGSKRQLGFSVDSGMYEMRTRASIANEFQQQLDGEQGTAERGATSDPAQTLGEGAGATYNAILKL